MCLVGDSHASEYQHCMHTVYDPSSHFPHETVRSVNVDLRSCIQEDTY